MRTTHWALAGLLAAGLSTAWPVASQAQSYRTRQVDTYGVAYKIGQQEGREEGERDARRGNRFELYRENDYRNGVLGYKPWYGPKEIYADGFRAGFAEGYRDSYRRFHRRHDWRDHDGRDDRDRDDDRDRY